MLKSVYRLDHVIEMIREEIAEGAIPSDELFDCIYPVQYRHLSAEFWTPTEAAARAARYLAGTAERILDVGSGSGKFALLAAFLFPNTQFIGVEYRPTLVTLSAALANAAGLKNVEFVSGNAFDLKWEEFAGLYLFNPFHEQRYAQTKLDYIDDEKVELQLAAYLASANETRVRLAQMPVGTRVSVYNGFHHKLSLPKGYSLADRSFVRGSPLINAQRIR